MDAYYVQNMNWLESISKDRGFFMVPSAPSVYPIVSPDFF